ncbi:MAG TPA: hypothetical protein PK095_01625 [Myxococcota bacterium]|nr:hypothetical protein [Myxococcota bacterium]
MRTPGLDRWHLSFALILGAMSPFVASTAAASTRIEVTRINVEGLAVHDLVCDLESGGLLAATSVVGALAKQREAIAKCGPAGEAARVSFEWSGSKTTGIKVIGASKPAVGTCVAKVLERVVAAQTGACTATLLTADNEAGKAAAAALSTTRVQPGPEPRREEAPKEPDWVEHYGDPKNWESIQSGKQGWRSTVPKGAEVKDAWVERGEVTWRGAVSEHRHQLLWIFWHPNAPLTPETLAWITGEAVTKSKEFNWIEVTTLPAKGDFPETVIEKALSPPHRFLRLAARGKHGSYVVLTLFAETMPDEVVMTWLKSNSFFAPE